MSAELLSLYISRNTFRCREDDHIFRAQSKTYADGGVGGRKMWEGLYVNLWTTCYILHTPRGALVSLLTSVLVANSAAFVGFSILLYCFREGVRHWQSTLFFSHYYNHHCHHTIDNETDRRERASKGWPCSCWVKWNISVCLADVFWKRSVGKI